MIINITDEKESLNLTSKKYTVIDKLEYFADRLETSEITCKLHDAAMLRSVILECKSHKPIAWINEDELPNNYPYDEMFKYSKVDLVRMFPVFAPITHDMRIEENV